MALRPYDITEDSNHSEVDDFGGFSIRETGGAASVTVTFRKAAVGGTIFMEVNLAASESATLVLDKYIPAEGGTYVQTTGTGTITGVLFGG